MVSLVDRLVRVQLDRIPSDWPAELLRVKESDVQRELASPCAFSRARAVTLLSPAADPYLEVMAQLAARLTRQRFGRVMNLYAPLYLSNVCINRCVYCGFSASHTKAPRRRLSVEEAEAEAAVIAQEGFRDLLLVSGEDPEFITLPYLEELVRRLRAHFVSISVEIYPLDTEGYRRLVEAGVDGVTLYQETYDRDVYAKVHPEGLKANYEKRLLAQEAAAKAGMRRLGIGALLGLADWRYETLAVAFHAHSLMQQYWKARVSISFPRLRPAPYVQMTIPSPVTDRDLVRMIVTLRLLFPDVGLVLSTRENAKLRDHLIPLGITQMSAGSRTSPGGYREPAGASEQFEVADHRSPREVAEVLRAKGLEPVWKDWDPGFDAKGGSLSLEG